MAAVNSFLCSKRAGGRVLFICFAILHWGCAPGVKITGVYTDRKRPDTYIIKEDSTFTYRYKIGYYQRWSNGYWKSAGTKKISLNSRLQNRGLPLTVREIDNTEDRNVIGVNINMPQEDKAYYQCSIYINDSLFVRKAFDSVGRIAFPGTISSIYFKVNADVRIPARSLDTLVTEKYYLTSPGKKELTATISYTDSFFNYRIFSNEIIDLTRKGMRYYDHHNGKWINLPRVK